MPAKLEAVNAILEIAEIQPGETLLDVGSGDGRVVIEAAMRCPGLKKAFGVELDEALVGLSTRRIKERAKQEGSKSIESPEQNISLMRSLCAATTLAERVEIIHADFMDVNMKVADVVVLFFLPHEKVANILQEKLRPGTRVVTYVFQIAQWKPVKVISTVPFMTAKGSSFVYLYRVPSVIQC